jgi:cytochrome c-type biogenesis protein CcmH
MSLLRRVIRRLRRLGALAGLLAATGLQAASPSPPATDPALEARVQALSAELRCLVCQNQSLADSHAELAMDLKNQVREQLRAGRSEAEVVDYLTDRYGDFVRYRPAFKPMTLLLWAGPVLLLLGGGLLLHRSLRRSAWPAADSAVDAAPDDDEERADMRALLQGRTGP